MYTADDIWRLSHVAVAVPTPQCLLKALTTVKVFCKVLKEFRMTSLLRALTTTGRLLKLPVCTVVRAPNFVPERTAFTSKRRVSILKRKRRPREVIGEESVGLLPSQLYEDEIGKDVFEARQDDLPNFNMTNPFAREKELCILCKYNITPDYKNVKLLSQFVSSHTGEIYGRHITGLCKIQQERVEAEITKSRSAGMMAAYFKHVEFVKDPKLCDPMKPTRPHPY